MFETNFRLLRIVVITTQIKIDLSSGYTECGLGSWSPSSDINHTKASCFEKSEFPAQTTRGLCI